MRCSVLVSGNGPFAAVQGEGVLVQRQPRRREHPLFGAEEAGDAREQHRGVVRFFDVVVAARGKPRQLVGGGGARGQENDGRGGRFLAAAAQLVAALAGEIDVDQGELAGRLRHGLIAVAAQKRGELRADVRVVLYDPDTLHDPFPPLPQPGSSRRYRRPLISPPLYHTPRQK